MAEARIEVGVDASFLRGGETMRNHSGASIALRAPLEGGQNGKLAKVHIFMYNQLMKKRDLERQLKAYGWWFLREGGRHEIWTNGELKEAVPRHTEIPEFLAKKILRNAGKNRGR